MPHVLSGCETMEEFVAMHKNQLLSCAVPEHLWESLFMKLKLEIFDAGDSFIIQQVVQESDDCEEDEDEEDAETCDDDADNSRNTVEQSVSWRVVVNKPGGLKTVDSNQVYLIDHAWTYRLNEARSHLESMPNLLPRLACLMGIETTERSERDVIDDIMTSMWRYNWTYNIGSAEVGTEAALPLWYIMDEFGSRIQHSDAPNVRIVPFCYVPTQAAFSIMWLTRDIAEGAEVTRDFLDGRVIDPLRRKLMLLPWQPDDMSHLSYELHEDEDLFTSKFQVHETLPNLSVEFLELPRDRSIRVYSDVEQVIANLMDPCFELVSTIEEADIIWTQHYLKDFKAFSEDTPEKRINQFPFEVLLTVKSVLPVVCRRGVAPLIDPVTLNTLPSWLPITFNLNTELAQFISYFQHRDACGLDNHWICKPYNLTRGLDICVTNNLGCILRLSDSGPKIVSKYIEDPVLLEREDIGPVKFDLRFIVMLISVEPLQLAVHEKFLVRVANKVFSLDDLDDYEKHFTVMNYKKGVQLKKFSCDEFIRMFNDQYSDTTSWENVRTDIFEMIRKVFEAGTSEEPPKGIGHSPQSRAAYGFDVMLKWQTSSKTGVRVIQPVLLEVNFGPDNTRFVREFPNFYNDLFSAMFLGDISNGRPIISL